MIKPLSAGPARALVAGLLFALSLPVPAGDTSAADAVHVLNRLGYGPSPDDIARVQRQGLDAWIDDQLHPERIPQAPELQALLDSLEVLDTPAAELYRRHTLAAHAPGMKDKAPPPAAARRFNLSQEEQLVRIASAAYSPRQLQEAMTEFWYNHFNVMRAKGQVWLTDYQYNVIHAHALGRFRDLLGGVAHHPLMLIYLNNQRNQAPRVDNQGRPSGLNENYARELLELHTLGVNGGYSQQDVQALARILTGWTVNDRIAAGENTLFRFDAARHDNGDKVLLGHRFTADGVNEGEKALDLLASHPATARYISTKLAQYFLSEQPPSALVARMAKVFLASDGDIRAVLKTLFDAPEFRARQAHGQLFKTPYQFAIGALRAANVRVEQKTLALVVAFLQQNNQPLYGWPTPDGYSFRRRDWLTPEAILRRIEFVQKLVARPTRTDDKSAPDRVARLQATLGPLVSGATRARLDGLDSNEQLAVLLGAPEMMMR